MPRADTPAGSLRTPVANIAANPYADATSGALALAAVAEAMPMPFNVAAISGQSFENGFDSLATDSVESLLLGPAASASLSHNAEEVAAPHSQELAARPAAEAVDPSSTAGFDLEALQAAVCDALASHGQQSLADQLGEAAWSVEGSQLRAQTTASKTILGLLFNTTAEKIARDALRASGAGGLKLVLLPGEPESAPAVKKARAPRTGSAQARAMEHPMVRQAQKLFNAEVRNVVDLREKD